MKKYIKNGLYFYIYTQNKIGNQFALIILKFSLIWHKAINVGHIVEIGLIIVVLTIVRD